MKNNNKKFKSVREKKKFYTKMLAIITVSFILINCTSCDKFKNNGVGSGTQGEVKAFSWTKYDKLIRECKNEVNQEVRNKKMFEAENLLLESGAVIPLVCGQNQYLCKDKIKDFYISYVGTPIIKFVNPKDGKKEIKVHICKEPDTVDPAQSASMETGTLAENYQGNLYRSTANGVEKELASDLKVSKDKLTYTIKIRKDAKWSDGKDLTAEDFKYTWDRAAKDENFAEYDYMFDPIEGAPNHLNVKVKDKKTLKIKLKVPCPYFKSLLAHSCYSPVRKDIVEKSKGYKDSRGNIIDVYAWGKHVPKVSCGAFTIDSWKHNKSIVLKKNPKYVFADKVKVDKVHLMLSNDSKEMYKLYKSGKICIDLDLPKDEIEKIQHRKDYKSKKSQEMSYIYFNLNSDIFNGMTAEEAKKFRKAIGFAIDRTRISKEALMGKDLAEGRIVSSSVHDGTGKKYIKNIKKMSKSYFKYGSKANLEKARELLKEVGFKFDSDGKIEQDMTVYYVFYNTDNHESVAEFIKSDLDKLGIKFELENDDMNEYNEKIEKGTFQASRGCWIPDYDDPMAFLELFTSTSSLNTPQLGAIQN